MRYEKLKRIIIFGLIVSVWIITSYAGDNFNKAGRTSMQFLKIGVGARPVALGEACIANLQEINAVFWNPAAITSIQSFEAGFTYTKWFGDLNFTSGAIGFRIGQLGVIALNYIALDYGNLQEAPVTSASGGAGLDTRTGYTFGGGDLAIGLTFARKYTDKLSIGVNVKYLREELYTFTSSLWAFDVGSYYLTGWRGIRLAMSAQNFAGQARWLHTKQETEQSFNLPLLFRIGWSIDLMGDDNLFLGGDPLQHRLSFNMDAIHSNDFAERLHIGAEYWLFNRFALRGGYRFNYDEGNLSLGCGLNYQLSSFDIQVDYAYVNYDFLESPHRVSLLMSF
jgi:hypothetical protein